MTDRTPCCVTVRGRQFDLSEVGQAMSRLPSVERVVTCLIDDDKLTAYVVLRVHHAPSTMSLRRALRASLPYFMIPSNIIFVNELPLTPDGKVDLESLEQNSDGKLGSTPYQTETETAIASIWSEAFDIPRIERHDDYFDLGGDSLNALDIVARIRSELRVEVPSSTFADNPSLADFATAVDRLRKTGQDDDQNPIIPAPRGGPLPLSFFQERLWNFSQATAGGADQTITVTHKIEGPLDSRLLQQSAANLVARHELLRTTFIQTDAGPRQIIHPPGPLAWTSADLSDRTDSEAQCSLLANRLASAAFDLSQLPLIRFLLVRMGENEHRFVTTIHHILVDREAMVEFFRELTQRYQVCLRQENNDDAPSRSLQYVDFALWQRRTYDRDAPGYRDIVDFWQKALVAVPRARRLPFQRLIPVPTIDASEGRQSWPFDRNITHRLTELGRMEAASLFVVRLAVFAALLSNESHERDVVIGTYVSTRTQRPWQKMFGLFVSIVPLRFTYNPECSFRDWLVSTRKIVSDAVANAAVPYEHIRNELQALSESPPAINVIVLPSSDDEQYLFAGMTMRCVPTQSDRMPWGFTLQFKDAEDAHVVQFDARLHNPAAVCTMIRQYRRLLGAVTQHPDESLSKLMATSANKPS